MKDGNLKFASLFSGCGGFDLGFISQGFRSCGAFDCDSDALNNYSRNIDGPVKVVDLNDGIPDADSLKGIDALIAGPPCQGFSTAGKRILHDKRNHLLTLTGHLALQIKPKVLVVENVSGALFGEHAHYWMELDETMRFGGYQTHTVRWQAADFGMAQKRTRMFFFAWRTGRMISFVPKKLASGNLRSCLSGVSTVPNHQPRLLNHGSNELMIARRIRPGQKLCNVRGGPNAVATWDIPEVFGQISENERTVLELLRRLRRQERQRDFGDADPVSLPRLKAALGNSFCSIVDILVAKGYLRRVNGGIDLVGTFNGKFRRLSWDKPSCTVDTRFGSPRYFLHPSQQRGFTVREAARIQGFADDYIFHGNEKTQFRLVGNAVPPPLGAHAAKFAAVLLGKPS